MDGVGNEANQVEMERRIEVMLDFGLEDTADLVGGGHG